MGQTIGKLALAAATHDFCEELLRNRYENAPLRTGIDPLTMSAGSHRVGDLTIVVDERHGIADCERRLVRS
jgi:hypothetical protein